MKIVDVKIVADEYGEEYAGVYKIRQIPYSEGRALLEKAARAKDRFGYVEDLVIACVSGPVELKREKLGDLPHQLLRRLMDETLALNEVSKTESAFL